MERAARHPNSGDRIAENAVGLDGAITVLVLALGILTPWHWLIGYTIADFAIKVLVGHTYSPNSRIANVVVGAQHRPAGCYLYGFTQEPVARARDRRSGREVLHG